MSNLPVAATAADARENGATAGEPPVPELDASSPTAEPSAVGAETDAQDVGPAFCGAGTAPDYVAEVSPAKHSDASPPPSRDRGSRALIKTTPLDPRDLRPSWPVAIASLEKISGWAVLALRLGTLALIQQCVRDLAQPSARAETVARLRALTEALAHMPLEA